MYKYYIDYDILFQIKLNLNFRKDIEHNRNRKSS